MVRLFAGVEWEVVLSVCLSCAALRGVCVRVFVVPSVVPSLFVFAWVRRECPRCVCGWVCLWWVVSRQSWLRALGAVPYQSRLGSAAAAGGWGLANTGGASSVQFPATPALGLLLVVVGGLSPFLDEGPGCSSPPILAGACCRRWWVVPRRSWLRALGVVPCHSWLESVAGGGGWSAANPA